MRYSPLPSRSSRPRRSWLRGALAALMLGLVLGACSDLTDESLMGPQQSVERPGAVGNLLAQDFGPAIAAQNRYKGALMNNPNIVGTGVGVDDDGQPSVRLFLMHGQVSGLPSNLDGIPVTTRVTGPFVLRNPQTRARPAPIGYSLGHPDITAGTIGARVTDGTNVFILSNNHILANSNNATIGDPALQPGPYDGGTDPDDRIGTLADFQEISFSSNNTIDAAIALVDGSDVSGSTGSEAYGAPSSTTRSATVGMDVQKFGRTTGHTFGTVEEINVTVSICFETRGPFGCASSATFVDQMSISDGSFSGGGDSGSLIVTNDSNANPVGLLFAGSSTRTLANPIDAVLDRFGVTIDPTVPGDGGGDPDPDPVGPTASFTVDCTELACDFDASGSTAGDASITSYDWTFGDGNTGSGATVSHTYGADGTYTVELTVTDGNDLTDSSSQNVAVEAAPDDGGEIGDPSIDSFNVSARSTGPWARATVQWSVSHPDGALQNVTTELLDSSGNPLDSISTSVSGSSASGEHELRTRSNPASVRITVTDTEGKTATQTVAY